jgi:hypothetical protein
MVLNNLRDFSRDRKLKHVGILLDQEKAYNRVHPEYLEMVLERFGFPQQVTRSILTLFFSTQISLNITAISQTQSLSLEASARGIHCPPSSSIWHLSRPSPTSNRLLSFKESVYHSAQSQSDWGPMRMTL